MFLPINRLFSKLNWRLFLFSNLLLLVGCGPLLDLKVTEKALKEELLKQGVGSLKEVSCPQEMKPGQKFECIGIFESGIGFRIPVEHKREGDKLTWEIPTIKGMLNMNQVMKAIQSELKVGADSLDCGTTSTYRMATLGSSFECTVVVQSLEAKAKSDVDLDAKPDMKLGDLPKGIAKSVKEPDKIEISIASSGDVTWQRLVAAPPGKAGDSKATIDPSLPKSDQQSGAADSKEAAKDKTSDPTGSTQTKPVVIPTVDADYDS
jgi:hypothetical protein